MEKTIIISGKPTRFKATGGVMLRYKQQFGTEFLAHLAKINDFMMSKKQKKVKEDTGQTITIDDYDYTKFNLEFAFNIAWTLAKTADPSIPDPLTWLDSYDSFEIREIMPQLNELLALSNTPKN